MNFLLLLLFTRLDVIYVFVVVVFFSRVTLTYLFDCLLFPSFPFALYPSAII